MNINNAVKRRFYIPKESNPLEMSIGQTTNLSHLLVASLLRSFRLSPVAGSHSIPQRIVADVETLRERSGVDPCS